MGSGKIRARHVLAINDAIIAAVAKLIDDSNSPAGRREPTHSEIEFYVGRAGLSHADPTQQGPVGKAKRVRTILSHALSEDETAGSRLIEALLSKVRSCGGFCESSPNAFRPLAARIGITSAPKR